MLKLITNVQVYAPEHKGACDILIANNKIASILPHSSSPPAFAQFGDCIEVIDGTGKCAFPGAHSNQIIIELLVNPFLRICRHTFTYHRWWRRKRTCKQGSRYGVLSVILRDSLISPPEPLLHDFVDHGITTVIGVLGTDNVSRSVDTLLVKARALNEEGITAFIFTGSYHLPIVTVTGSIKRDIVLVEQVVGVGEIAISDHRSSVPSFDELARIASEARYYHAHSSCLLPNLLCF